MDETVVEMDSIMTRLLRSAMDSAYETVQSKPSPIECLIETSKFYELAIILINGGLELTKKDPNDQIPKTSRNKTFTDLTELRDLLRERLNHTKRLIIEKDKELIERFENEFSNLNDQANDRLQPDNRSHNLMIEQMATDIDVFKRTLDLTFGHTHDVIGLKNKPEENTVDDVANKDAIIKRLLEQRQESSIQTMAMEEHYMLLMNNCYNDFWSHDIETKVREDVFSYVVHEVAKDWRAYDEHERLKTQLTDEIYKSVFVETINDIRIKLHSAEDMIRIFLTDFQEKVSEKLHTNFVRLEQMTHRVDTLSGIAASIRNNELVYKKAFARRCENLVLAETEVDLLGNQVEALQDLLRKIYYVLVQNTSCLPHDFEVMNILKLIKEELRS